PSGEWAGGVRVQARRRAHPGPQSERRGAGVLSSAERRHAGGARGGGNGPAPPLDDAILDGEAIALRPDGTPLPFQVTMRRFGRKLDVERLRAELPLSAFFFDVLYAD